MLPDVLPAISHPKPVTMLGRFLAVRRSTLIPVLLSSVACGIWLPLAFLPGRGTEGTLIMGLLSSLFFTMLFLGAVNSASTWAASPASAIRFQKELARCSYATFVLLLFLPEYLARLRPPLVRSGLLLTIVALLWLTVCAVTIRKERDIALSATSIRRVAIASIGLLFAVVTALTIRKYVVFGYVGQDIAYFGQIMFTTLHGHLFWGNLLQDLIYSKPVATDFAGHVSPVMFLFLPFYAAVSSPVTLLLLRNILLFCSAIPVYWLARRRVDAAAAWLWVAAFMLTPAIFYQNTFDFYPLTLVALPLLFTLFFYLERRYIPFCIAVLLTLSVREDLVFFVFGLGLIALLHRRSLRWSAMPILLSLVWGAIAFLVVLPAALHGATFVTDACFSHLGNTRSEMIRRVLTHPGDNILVHSNLVYAKTLLTSTGMAASFGSPFALLSLPYVAINLLGGAGRCITNVIFAQYSVIPATLIFAATLATATRRGRTGWLYRLSHLGLHNDLIAPILMIALACASLTFVTGKPQIDELREQPWGDEARQILTLVPPAASVAAPRYMLPHLANRNCLYQTHRLHDYRTMSAEYLIFDTDWNHINAASQYEAQYHDAAAAAAADPQLQVIYSSAQYRVYRNAAMQGVSCEPVQDHPNVAHLAP